MVWRVKHGGFLDIFYGVVVKAWGEGRGGAHVGE